MSAQQRKEFLSVALPRLLEAYGDAECSLHFRNPFELLVATILSAQCTDERVNKVTPALFKRFPDARALAQGSLKEIEKLVQSTGFYRNKAKNLKAMATDLVAMYSGEVPRSMPELNALAGVGRKTANVVMGNAFGEADGVVVDTHVGRLSRRMGLTKKTDAVQIERELNSLVPREHWVAFPHWLIQHGRKICSARKALCQSCFLADICPKKGISRKQLQALKLPAPSATLSA
jgi:endonuclease-3